MAVLSLFHRSSATRLRSLAPASGALSSARSLTTSTPSDDDENTPTANVVLIGAGWWSQGWHLPHLHRNRRVTISAIVDPALHPKSNLNPHLEPLDTLAQRYNCPVYHSLTDLLKDPIGQSMDGAIVCTPHSTHFDIGKELIGEGRRRYDEARQNNRDEEEEVTYRPVNVLMEKPMTTNVGGAKELHNLLLDRRRAGRTSDNGAGGGVGCFLLNHTANYRPQARAARLIVRSGGLGTLRHVSASFASPLSWIFDDPRNAGWNEPDDSGEMVGNGFAWGQSSHLLAWIYHVAGGGGGLAPSRVRCAMTTSGRTGADVSHAATVTCGNGATMSLSGTSLLPGNAHSDPPVAKRVRIEMYGTEGALFYGGNDRDPTSGKLEWSRGGEHENAGSVEIQCPELGFQFEELDQEGIGPESLQCFIDACLGRDDYYLGADSLVGLRSVQTIDAMYRSHVSGNCEDVKG